MTIIQRFLDAWDWFWRALELPSFIGAVIILIIFFGLLFTGRMSIRAIRDVFIFPYSFLFDRSSKKKREVKDGSKSKNDSF